MPVYVYRCQECGKSFEKRQSFSDAPLTECELCQGRLRKVLQPTTVIFKGPGFYSTDYQSKSDANGRNGESHKEDDSKPAEPASGSAEKAKEPAKSATATTGE